tara:strand:+ start:823 stop:1062 length:240 start_codon:yes stop_codon:yes gene_type:complete
MPIGVPKSGRKQPYNGAGMRLLSKEKRAAIGKRMAKKSKESRSGWPSSIQREGENNKHTYLLADEEWARRIAASKGKTK